MPWIVRNVMHAYGPYILLSVPSVPFAKMDRVMSAETVAFPKAAFPTLNRVYYFNHRTLEREAFVVSVTFEVTVPSMSSRSYLTPEFAVYTWVSPADQNKIAT